ncbi:hypothetical protein BX600DRAFT_467956 [Xylariales sp. PMI_506]|nr:hypothetical protein BX600DRAFT_467956 [Xylariales sp. PMI_506]
METSKSVILFLSVLLSLFLTVSVCVPVIFMHGRGGVDARTRMRFSSSLGISRRLSMKYWAPVLRSLRMVEYCDEVGCEVGRSGAPDEESSSQTLYRGGRSSIASMFSSGASSSSWYVEKLSPGLVGRETSSAAPAPLSVSLGLPTLRLPAARTVGVFVERVVGIRNLEPDQQEDLRDLQTQAAKGPEERSEALHLWWNSKVANIHINTSIQI